MRIIFFFISFLISLSFFAQNETLPEGWDLITLEGKPAYMNLITGDVSIEKPTLPASKPQKKVEVDPSKYHKVVKGETLYSIARKYNISVQEIYKLNSGFDYNNLRVGQEIVVSYDKSKEGKIVYVDDSASYTDPSNNTLYYVKKGDTLYSISRKSGVSVSDLKKFNNLTSNEIFVGQKISLQNK